MDTASSLVFRHGRILAIALAALILCGLVLIILTFGAEVPGAGPEGLMPETRLSPFRWGHIDKGLA